jgi:hypothetical protein
MHKLVRIAVLGAAVAASACNSARGKPPDLSAYGGIVEKALFAWGWGAARPAAGGKSHPVRVLFRIDPDATAYRLLSCDPVQSLCEHLGDFVDLALKWKKTAGGILGEFRTGLEEKDRHLVVIADRGRTLLRSETIIAAVQSRPTRRESGTLKFDRAQQRLSWSAVPDAGLYVVTVHDEDDDMGAAAVTTERLSWAYPQLVGIVQHFHDPERVPDLERGKKYEAELFALDEHGWAIVFADAAIVP